jgi:nuclear transport factor 2 (NTF2) superfamily protein
MTAEHALRPEAGWASQRGHIRMGRQERATGPAEAIDRLLVAERIARYGWAYDERDRAALTDCFTEDGVWEGLLMGRDAVGPFTGRSAVVEFLAGFWQTQTDQRRHMFTNVVVEELSPAAATAHAYLLLTSASEGVLTPVSSGPYRFALACAADGTWRIRHLAAGFDVPF